METSQGPVSLGTVSESSSPTEVLVFLRSCWCSPCRVGHVEICTL